MELIYILFAAILATTSAEVARIKKCDDVSQDACEVTQVRITPCTTPKACVFKKGQDVSLSFDFTPNFSATKLKTEVYWDNGFSDIPFADMGSNDGCTYTQCPTETGRSQVLNYNMNLNKKTPQGFYTIKWKVWNEENKEQLCCFKTSINIKK